MSLKKLWLSTLNLHQRFNLIPPPRPAVRKVFQEEVRELLEEAKRIDGIQAQPNRVVDDLVAPRQAMAEEAADVIVTVCAMLQAYGVTRRELKRAMNAVACKNDAKIPGVTHSINKAGKIARITVTPVDTNER